MAERLASRRDSWIERNAYFYEQDEAYMRFLVPEGLRVLDLGCGTGRLLAALKPSRGVGVDLSASMLEVARSKHPALELILGDIEDPKCLDGLEGPFDVVILSDTVGSLEDCQATFERINRLCLAHTRVIVAYYSRLWEPVLRAGELVGQKMPIMQQNWLSTEDIVALLRLADFEVVRREWRQLLPRWCFGLGAFVNNYLAPWPVIRRACLRNYVVARSRRASAGSRPSTTVVIPCRNERDNIEPAVKRLPRFCADLEIVFVEGHSKDGTLEEIHRVVAAYPHLDIKVLVQPGRGKGDAVRAGFAAARGEVLMILDADLTTPPEWMPKFYEAIASGKGEFINGSRLVYPMQDEAMQMLNHIANHVFSWIFTWLLGQRFTDTLCGTKVLTKEHYARIAAGRPYFGDFDPFGDFDLILGASKLNLKVVEIPVAYASRSYGETQISRFVHGWLLLRMVVFAFKKLKMF
jgi:ubiquinone/menaquinone biosynthesis C-methylase UbiE